MDDSEKVKGKDHGVVCIIAEYNNTDLYINSSYSFVIYYHIVIYLDLLKYLFMFIRLELCVLASTPMDARESIGWPFLWPFSYL